MDVKDSKNVYILVEPSVMTPVWFSNSIEGIRTAAAKQKKTVRQLDGTGELDRMEVKPVALIIISTNNEWTRQTINYCRMNSIRPILIGGLPSRFGEDVSGTVYSSKSSIEELLGYFKSCDRKRVAMIGINDRGSNDVLKAEAFLSAARSLGISVSMDDVYSNSNDSRNPNERFFANISHYNGVICSNDYIAAYVLSYAREHGISVPGDLYVSGLGDCILCRYTTPSLTSATRSYFKTGEQAFFIWKQLNSEGYVFSIVVTVQCEVKPRGSTDFSPLPNRMELLHTEESGERLAPDTVLDSSNAIKGLANCLSSCDKLDMEIIRKIMDGVSTENLADQLFISTSTARYRLKKIYSAANTNSRREFVALFNAHINRPRIFEDIEEFEQKIDKK